MSTITTDRARALRGLAAAWYAIETATDDDDYMRAVDRANDVQARVGEVTDEERRLIEDRMEGYRREDAGR